MRYYNVEAICGHVGRNRCVIKNLAIAAGNGKAAALIGRNTPRVKHDLKNAIRSVSEISYQEFLMIRECNDYDPYFHCQNVQEQRAICGGVGIIDMSEINEDMKVSKDKNRDSRKFRYKRDVCRAAAAEYDILDWQNDGPFAV